MNLLKKNFQIEIEVIEDGINILDTGGGILNLISRSDDEDFEYLIQIQFGTKTIF